VTSVGARLAGIDWDFVFTRVAVVAVAVSVFRAAQFVSTFPRLEASFGVDHAVYELAAERWMAGGTFYLPFQLDAQYEIRWWGEVLYPPVILWLLVPMSFLPGALWWLIPGVLFAAAVLRLRPRPWGLALAAGLSVLPWVQDPILWGNPVMWLTAAVAWGLLVGWPSVLVLAKPTVGLYVLTGLVRPKAFLVGLAVLLAASVPFGWMWLDWATAVRNSGLHPLYSLSQYVILSIPVVLFAASEASTPFRLALAERFRGRLAGLAEPRVARTRSR
jgi:hypothetical protein